MDPREIEQHEAFELPWYYTFELAPGVFTKGQNPKPVAQARELLRHVDIEGTGENGARCLDVGMMEGLVSTLMERRGASQVLGYDRKLRDTRIGLLRQALGVQFETLGDVTIRDLPAKLRQLEYDPFDVVVFSGVLYHMFDPLGGLAAVRGLVREGGICILETTVAFEDSEVMHFNTSGRFTPYALWFMTPRILDYLARFTRLKPIDAVYRPGRPAEDGKPPQGRAAIACRAMPDAVPDEDDDWMRDRSFGDDFTEFLDWDSVASDGPEVGYSLGREGLVLRGDGSVDVHASIAATDGIIPKPDQVQLNLGDKY